jgi:hypothetical protein
MQKAGLEGELARLERQRAAHFDDQLSVRRHISAAERDLQAAQRRIEQIGEDLQRRTSTRGDAFALVLGDRRVEDRRTAGALLLSKVRLALRGREQGDLPLGSIGGFELVCSAGRTWRQDFEAALIMRRSGLDQHVETEPDLTPTGLIARIEHLLERMPQDLQEQERRAVEAERRRSGYQQRLGTPFPLQAELDGKLAQLAALDADLAATNKQPQALAPQA